MTAPNPKITQRQALEAAWPYGRPGDEAPTLTLMETYDVPWKVAAAKLEGLVEKGLADYGTSVGGTWRTPEGEARLAELRASGTP